MVPLIQEEAVDRAGWLTTAEFLDGIAISQLTPGPFAILATFVGFKAAGLPGALTATLGIFTPSLLVGWGILRLHSLFRKVPAMDQAWATMRAAVVGLLLGAVVRLGISSVQSLPLGAISLGAFVAIRKGLSPLLVLLFAAFLGLVFF